MEYPSTVAPLDDLHDLGISNITSRLRTSSWSRIRLSSGACKIAQWFIATVIGHMEGSSIASFSNKDLIVGHTSFGDYPLK
jgi:hypothetical protein